MLEHEDFTESSDDLSAYYVSDEEKDDQIKGIVAEHLNELTKRPLSRLDRILLKGFYTNDRSELENATLLSSLKKETKQSFLPDINEKSEIKKLRLEDENILVKTIEDEKIEEQEIEETKIKMQPPDDENYEV